MEKKPYGNIFVVFCDKKNDESTFRCNLYEGAEFPNTPEKVKENLVFLRDMPFDVLAFDDLSISVTGDPKSKVIRLSGKDRLGGRFVCTTFVDDLRRRVLECK